MSSLLNFAKSLSVALLVTLVLAVPSQPLRAQEPSPSPSPASTPESKPEAVSEADPTRAMFLVIRNEYRDLRNGSWANTIVARHDRITFRNVGLKGGAKGSILRFELPLSIVHTPSGTKAGLGDIYLQALLIPRISRRFAFSAGTGLILPTATSSVLGQGKLVVAPLMVPLWYLASRRRLVTMRLQHFVSVAGNGNRPNVNYTVFDPFIGLATGRRSWIFADTELKWDWRRKLNSAVTAVQFGRIFSDRMGFWIKPEIPWGPGRGGGFNIKVGIFRFR